MSKKDNKKWSNYIDLSKIDSLSKGDIKLFQEFFEFLNNKKEFREYLEGKKEARIGSIPISIFKNKKLAPLETVVKYLREDLGHTYKKIGILLNRKPGPIGVSYRKAAKKSRSRLDVSSVDNSIPLSVFKDSRLTVFGTIVVYLRDVKGLKFGEISELLNRNYRTVYTVYSRARKKNVR